MRVASLYSRIPLPLITSSPAAGRTKFEQIVFKIVTRTAFAVFIAVVICCNILVLSLEHYDQSQQFASVLENLNWYEPHLLLSSAVLRSSYKSRKILCKSVYTICTTVYTTVLHLSWHGGVYKKCVQEFESVHKTLYKSCNTYNVLQQYTQECMQFA